MVYTDGKIQTTAQSFIRVNVYRNKNTIIEEKGRLSKGFYHTMMSLEVRVTFSALQALLRGINE